MVQKGQKGKQEQTSFCLVPGLGVGVPTKQLLACFEECQKEQSVLEQPSDLAEPPTPNSEGSLVGKEEEQNKGLFSKRSKVRSCGEAVPRVQDYEAKVNFAVDANLKLEESLVEERHSEKATQSMGGEQHCAASKTALQKKIASRRREKRCSSLPEMRACGKDTASKKNRTCSLLEPKPSISSCLERGNKYEKKRKRALSEACTEIKNNIEMDGGSPAIEPDTPEAIGKSKKRSVSKLGSWQISQYVRERSRLAHPEQESVRNQDTRQRAKRTHRLANLGLVVPWRKEQALQQTYKRSVELAQTKSCEDLESLKKTSSCLLDSVGCLEDSKKCGSVAVQRRHKMVTRALLKSKICENDSEKLDWKEEKSVAMEIPRIGTLEKTMVMGQIMDSAPTEGEQEAEISNRQYGKLPKIDLSVSQDFSLPKLLVQSACLQITNLNEPEHKDPVYYRCEREAAIHCGSSSFPVTNSKCPQLWDIQITEKKVGKGTLVVYQDDKLRCLTKLNDSPCRVIKNPVVILLDCSYIKALLNSTSNQTFQSYKLHCEFLHVTPSQRKDLCLNRGMGQNDLNSTSNIMQAGRSFFQTNILVGKGMHQNRNTTQRCQNGKKRFRESEWSLEYKKNSKKIKITEDLERSAVQEVLSDMDLCNEYRLQIDENAVADPSIIKEELNYKTISLSSFGMPDFLLQRHAQGHQNQLVSLPSNKQKRKSHFALYNANDLKSEFQKENGDLVSKTIEPHTDFTRVKDDSVVDKLVGERITNCSNNVGYPQSGKAAPKGKTVSKTGKILQFSCQRIVPFSGKNIWPRESCARTSLWFCKDHVSGSEFLRGTDSFANTAQMELHKLLVDTSKVSAIEAEICKTDLSVVIPDAESQTDTPKHFSGIGNKNRNLSNTGRPKQCLSRVTKNAKKCKMTLNSVKDIKNEESVAKINVSTGTQNDIFVDNSKNKTKSLVLKQETAIPQVLKLSSTGNLSKYRIPLLKDKGALRKEKNCYNPQNISAATVKKDRSKRSSFGSEHQFHSEKINGITVVAAEEHADRFGSSVSGSFPRANSVCNKNLATSLENDIESSTLKDISNSLSIGCTKKPTEIPVSSEINKDNWSNTLVQDKDKFCADVLKAYEDDALVLDVIQDDPELFGNTDELSVMGSNVHVTDNNCSITTFSGKLEVKLELPPLSRSSLSKFRPKESPVQVHDTQRSTTEVSASLTEGDGAKSDSLSRTSLTRDAKELSFKDGQLTELEDLSRSSDVKYKFSEEMTAVKEKEIQETNKIENPEHQHVNLDQPELPLPPVKTAAPQWQGTVAKPWMNDFRFSWKGPLTPSTYPSSSGSLQAEKNTTTCLGLTLPRGYCRFYFNSLNGCVKTKCWYAHVLEAGDAKLCNKILKKYISMGEKVLLQRAVQIFTDYYKDVTQGVQLDSQILNDLLISVLQCCLLKELFHILRTCLLIKVLPTVDVFLKVFEHVASMKLKEVIPELIDISSKFADNGMVLEYEHFGCITKFLNQLQISSQEITIFISRFQARRVFRAGICDFTSAIAEFQHCKEKGDWAKLGTVYIHVKRDSENVDDREKYSLFVTDILINAVKEGRPGVPFCEFAAAVNAELRHNEADKTLLGRIGISVLYAYYKIHLWLKARKVLDTLHALQIHFTYLKGLIGPERSAPRCEIVNIAVEVFLNSGSLDGAVWILKESEWVINTLSWPCDRIDVLNRHNLLCKIASEYITKNRCREAFEVLRNLPGFQNSCDSLDVSQYSFLFNKLLGASTESKSLVISSAVIDFMLAKNIPVDFELLRAFITALGRSNLWLKARTYYKSASALGCYPPLEGNLYRKLLLIPSYVTEVEMLLAIEIFLVSNASSIQSPGASNQILQIVLKRCESNSVRTKDDYQSAVERLIQATQLATPKLFLKHLTVNVNQEEVYSLEHSWVLKWLKENMKWAGKVWLFP
ncbi:protein TOPAZ1 isoform X2 [Paroedura picta]|uniref:protein TOPAZ1 isoform X2 n=1 Tax=Paroedura picta TaxID=143630 RepID=UPI0040569408